MEKLPTNYIKSLRFSRKGNTPKGTTEILFDLPKKGEHVISVICGKNRTGKSYLLKTIKKCFEVHNKKISLNETPFSTHIPDNDVQIEITEKDIPLNYFLISNVHDLLRYIKTISIEQDTKFRQRGPRGSRLHYDDPVRLKIAFDDFSEDVIKFLNPKFDSEKWEKLSSYRSEIVSSTFKKNNYYKLDSQDSLVSSFLKATGGHLYIGWNHILAKTNLTLYLFYDEDRIIHFENWSEGQKVLFLSLVVSKYLTPDILLFDEIENHLHPEFISILLEYFKSTIKQCILSSHHPHIIFSKYVNTVWYFEIENQTTEYPKIIDKKINRPQNNIAPIRKCFELIKNYHKVAKVYDLFDNFDNNLIKLSLSVLSDFNDYISEIFTNIYHYGIVESQSSKKIDLQVEGLLKHVLDKIDRKGQISILEIGSGKGRVLLDIAKLRSSKISEKVSWTLYEPILPVYDSLGENIAEFAKKSDIKYDITITNSLTSDQKFDIIFFANVIHEVTPNILSNYFSKLPSLLLDDGEVIIIDIFPLLMPEYFSVPYKRIEIETMFRKLNWIAYSESLNIKNSKVEAYWTALRKKQDTFQDETGILHIIENFWQNEIMLNRCADYSGRSEFKSADDSIRLMSELTTIASICSYQNKEWQLNVL